MNNLIPSKGTNLLPVSRANEMIALYLENKERILATDYKKSNLLAISETFNAEDVKLLLSQPDCVGFRIKYGMDEKLWVHSILVGVDQNGNDILINNLGLGFKEGEDYVVENASRCPPDCPTLNK